jgi:hypothetical protein
VQKNRGQPSIPKCPMPLFYFSYGAFYFNMFLLNLPISTSLMAGYFSMCNDIFVDTFPQKLDRDVEQFGLFG